MLKRELDKKISILFFIAAGLFLLFSFVFWPSLEHEKLLNQRIKNVLNSEVTEVSLSELTDFEWDRVCYLNFDDDYYFSKEDISKIIGFNYSGRLPSQACDTNKYNAFLFTDTNQKSHLVNLEYCSPILGDDLQYIRENLCFDNQLTLKIKARDSVPQRNILILQPHIDDKTLTK